MRRLQALLLASMLTFGTISVPAYAHSLDEVIQGDGVTQSQPAAIDNGTGGNTENAGVPENTGSADTTGTTGTTGDAVNTTTGNINSVNSLKDATKLDVASPAADKVNQGIKNIASVIVQVLAYGVTALLVLRVLLDLAYITLPFTRSFLANGYGGNPQAGAGGMPGQPGMGGPMGGMGGMGMGGYGSRYGMGGMGGMGAMGGMGMGGMQNQMSQPGASPAMGRIQWVSNAALNAVAGETVVGPDGKAVSPLKTYSKDMIIILVLTPIFLILAITGTLTNLGIMIGEALSNAVSNMGSMM